MRVHEGVVLALKEEWAMLRGYIACSKLGIVPSTFRPMEGVGLCDMHAIYVHANFTAYLAWQGSVLVLEYWSMGWSVNVVCTGACLA